MAPSKSNSLTTNLDFDIDVTSLLLILMIFGVLYLIYKKRTSGCILPNRYNSVFRWDGQWNNYREPFQVCGDGWWNKAKSAVTGAVRKAGDPRVRSKQWANSFDKGDYAGSQLIDKVPGAKQVGKAFFKGLNYGTHLGAGNAPVGVGADAYDDDHGS